MKSLSFALRSAITVTSVTFAFFLTLIYLEDYIIFNPTSSFYVKFIGPEIYLGRLLISAALSFSNGLITFIFITSFNNRLIEFSRMILDWARKTSSEYDLLSNSGYREINDIKEVFRSSIHAVKARETQNFNSIIKENNKVLIEQILENMYSIEKVPLKGIDIEFFPFRSRTYDNDLMNFIPTRNGCIVIITGFKKDNILTASYKARIQSIIEFTKSLSYTVEEELISAIQDSIRAFPIEHLNFTLAYFSRTSNL
ncbi:MAG: hypothetical protein KDK36_20430, partial [Leptospiraceae bacterium]|nr:hypothetical protein [Leptospiraceae bacterium]